MTADEIIALLDLKPHTEGGWYRQTWAEGTADGARGSGTCIYFLLKAGERSHWHRVDAVEIWHYYAGAGVTLKIAESAEGPAQVHKLGPSLEAGECPHVIVPKDFWQSAALTQDTGWSLVGCTVSPGFRFEGFVLAPPDFAIPTD